MDTPKIRGLALAFALVVACCIHAAYTSMAYAVQVEAEAISSTAGVEEGVTSAEVDGASGDEGAPIQTTSSDETQALEDKTSPAQVDHSGQAIETANRTVDDQDVKSVQASPSKTVASGFTTTGSGTYYYQNGKKLVGELCVGGAWYYFDPAQDGAMAKGFAKIPSQNKTVYYASNGRMVYGQQMLGKYWYYFDEVTGAMATGFTRIAAQNKTVYYAANGRMLYGELQESGKWYYLDPHTGAVTYGFAYIPGQDKWVFYDRSTGVMLYGERFIDGGWYNLDKWTGAVSYEWVHHDDAGKWVYYDGVTGRMVYGERYVDDDIPGWCYFDPGTGQLIYGWHRFSTMKKWVYYDTTTGRMYKKSASIDGVWHEIDPVTGAVDSSDMQGRAIAWAKSIAADASHGYTQGTNRWGQQGDYDCSSLVITALIRAGLSIDTAQCWYTKNMKGYLTSHEFVWITDLSKRQRGDILLNNEYHTAMCVDNKTIIEATVNEFGGIIGGKPGDQSGDEIHVRSYYSYPWNGILRFVG